MSFSTSVHMQYLEISNFNPQSADPSWPGGLVSGGDCARLSHAEIATFSCTLACLYRQGGFNPYFQGLPSVHQRKFELP